jgi:glycosyltransferase involved in cell wall biosynthesis
LGCISVVIPVFNGADHLGEQLAAVAAQEFDGEWEVVAVDNGSTDGSMQILEECVGRLPLRIERCPQRGVNAARNAGAAVARFDRLAFLDQDDVAAPGWLAAIDAALDKHRLVGGRLDHERLNAYDVLDSRGQAAPEHELPRFRGAPFAIGCNMACRRDVFMELGGFDPELLPAADDMDFCFRAQHAEITVTFVPEAVVAYRLRGTVAEYRQQMRRYAIGHAQLDAKLRGLGLIAPQSWKSRAAAIAGHLRGVLSVNLWFSRVGRWKYAQRFGNATGAVIGFVRFHQVVN